MNMDIQHQIPTNVPKHQTVVFFKTIMTGLPFAQISIDLEANLKPYLGENPSVTVVSQPIEVMPASIPRLQVENIQNKEVGYYLALDRIQINFSKIGDGKDFLKKIIEYLEDEQHIMFKRFGLVQATQKMFNQIELNELREKFPIYSTAPDKVNELSYRLNMPIEFHGFKCNNIEQIGYSVFSPHNKESMYAIDIIRDINTSQMESYTFNTDDIINLFNAFHGCINSSFIPWDSNKKLETGESR